MDVQDINWIPQKQNSLPMDFVGCETQASWEIVAHFLATLSLEIKECYCE